MPLQALENDDDNIGLEDAVITLTETTTKALAKQAADVKALGDQYAKLEAKMGRPGASGIPVNDNVKGGTLSAELKALGGYARTGNDAELKAMSLNVDTEGGYLEAPALSDQMTKRLYDQATLRRLARVVTIGSGSSFQEPLDLGDVGAVWVGETQSRPATTTPQIGLLDVPCNEVYALQPVTQGLIDDARFDVGSWLNEKIADRFARTEGAAFVNGSGILQPRGFLQYSTDTAVDITRASTKLQHVVSGGATTITADALRDLFWAVRAPHRVNGTWVMASGTANAIDKLKNGTGDYIWRDSSASGVPPTLLGKPVEFDENLPAIGAGTFPIAFGDWRSGYLIVEKLGLRMLRDPYSSKPSVLFYAYKRVGGAVANFDAIKLMKVST